MSNQKIAIVTGGNRGLGRSTALHLAAAGTDVVLTYRANAEEAATVVKEIEELGRTAVALPLDATDLDALPGFADTVRKTLAANWSRDGFDVLVNNAGAITPTPIGATERAAVEQMVTLHFTSVLLLTQALLPLLSDGGRIVNTSTGLARFTGRGEYSAYAAAKGAVEVWTRYLANELGPRGITVNTVAPGPIATDFGGGYLCDDEGVRSHLSGQIALGRVGEPEDIGRAVAAMASDGFGYVTGQRIEVSGGMLL